MFATELGIHFEDDEEEERPVAVRILSPSGETVLEEQLPEITSIGSLLQRLSVQSEVLPGRLSLLRGTDLLSRSLKLKDLCLAQDDSLCLIKRPSGTYTEWEPSDPWQKDIVAKLLLIGGAGVGKTAWLRSLCHEPFTETYLPTIGIDFKIKHLQSEDKLKIQLQLWDTAGQHRFRSITNSYMQGASGFLVLFSMTSRASVEEALQLMEAARHIAPEAARCMCLIGTHADCADPEVTEDEGMQIARELKCPYFSVSAKMEQGTELPFFTWLDLFMDTQTRHRPAS